MHFWNPIRFLFSCLGWRETTEFPATAGDPGRYTALDAGGPSRPRVRRTLGRLLDSPALCSAAGGGGAESQPTLQNLVSQSLAEADARIKEPYIPDDLDELLRAIHAHPYFVEVQQRLVAFGPNVLSYTRRMFADGQGGYTPERQQIHEQVVASFLPRAAAVPANESPTAWLLMGYAGSGKTTALAKVLPNYTRTLAHLDADDIQARLPDYQGWNADLFHGEAHDILWQILLPRAVTQRSNLVLDGTGHKLLEMQQLTDLLVAHGYRLHLLDIKVPIYLAVYRCWVRFRAGEFSHDTSDPDRGRFVPPEAVLHGGDPEHTYRALQQNPHVASWLQVDTSGRQTGALHVVEQGHR